jgi:hypothetical protein
LLCHAHTNLLIPRIATAQKRNVIEVRVPGKLKRRYKMKEYTKRSYKNYDLQEALKEKAKAEERARTGMAARK